MIEDVRYVERYISWKALMRIGAANPGKSVVVVLTDAYHRKIMIECADKQGIPNDAVEIRRDGRVDAGVQFHFGQRKAPRL